MNISGRTTGPDEIRARAEGAREYSLERDPRTVWAWALSRVRELSGVVMHIGSGGWTDLAVRRAAELCMSDLAKSRHPKVQAKSTDYYELAKETTRCLDILEAVKPLVAVARTDADLCVDATEDLGQHRAAQKAKWATGDRKGSAAAKKMADDLADKLPRLRLALPVVRAYDGALGLMRNPSRMIDAHIHAVRGLASAMFEWSGRAFFVTPCDVGGAHYVRGWCSLGECTTVALHHPVGGAIGFHLTGPGANRNVDLDVLCDAIGHVIGHDRAGWVSLDEIDTARPDVIAGRVHPRKAAP